MSSVLLLVLGVLVSRLLRCLLQVLRRDLLQRTATMRGAAAVLPHVVSVRARFLAELDVLAIGWPCVCAAVVAIPYVLDFLVAVALGLECVVVFLAEVRMRLQALAAGRLLRFSTLRVALSARTSLLVVLAAVRLHCVQVRAICGGVRACRLVLALELCLICSLLMALHLGTVERRSRLALRGCLLRRALRSRLLRVLLRLERLRVVG